MSRTQAGQHRRPGPRVALLVSLIWISVALAGCAPGGGGGPLGGLLAGGMGGAGGPLSGPLMGGLPGAMGRG